MRVRETETEADDRDRRKQSRGGQINHAIHLREGSNGPNTKKTNHGALCNSVFTLVMTKSRLSNASLFKDHDNPNDFTIVNFSFTPSLNRVSVDFLSEPISGLSC